VPDGINMEKYRPKFHFTAEKYIINDPNGLVYYEGEYHLFHQYNILEEIYWGHAVSEDLIHWKRLENAIAPDEHGQIWSGSAVVDEENHRLAAFFTYCERETERQSQGLAFSYDKGRSWEKYEKNPVLTEERKDFRDPKVFRYEDKWIMVVTGGDCVLFYESTNLIHWRQLSLFRGSTTDHVGTWECPDLFPLKAENAGACKWVLVISINDGSPAGGTGMKYFIGEFDGTSFRPDEEGKEGNWLDYGKDFYAGVSWNNISNGRRIMIAWADNWQYRDALPTYPFKGQMSSIRELYLKKIGNSFHLRQQPIEEMHVLRKNSREMHKMNMGAGEEWTLKDHVEALELELSYPINRIHSAIFGIRVVTGQGKQLEITFSKKEQSCTVDRRNAGINPHEKFPGKYKSKLDFSKEFLTLRLLLDVSQSELFVNEGELVFSNLIFPEDLYQIKLFTEGGDLEIEKCVIYDLDGDVIS
jgi:beta-fructosidases (levanase/invertase)